MKTPISLIALFGLFISGHSQAQDMPKWKNVAGWEIRVDTTLNYGCFLYSNFKGGTIFRMGFNLKKKNGYFILGNSKWQSLEKGKEYKIKVRFGNLAAWSGPAKVITMGDNHPFLMLDFSKFEFMTEFKSQHWVSFSYSGRQLAKLSLKGSSLAMEELARCQAKMEEMRNRGSNNKDPFAGVGNSSPRRDDPFSY